MTDGTRACCLALVKKAMGFAPHAMKWDAEMQALWGKALDLMDDDADALTAILEECASNPYGPAPPSALARYREHQTESRKPVACEEDAPIAPVDAGQAELRGRAAVLRGQFIKSVDWEALARYWEG